MMSSSNHSPSKRGCGGRKKVEFASKPETPFEEEISSNKPQHKNQSSLGNNAWDSEADYMLSYFLGGDFTQAGFPELENVAGSSERQHNESKTTPGNLGPPGVDSNTLPAIQEPAIDGPIAAPLGQVSSVGKKTSISFCEAEALDEPMDPITPKPPQYYAARRPASNKPTFHGNEAVSLTPKSPPKPSSSGDLSSQRNPQSAVPSSASSSSSSLSTMTNSLVTGGPILVQHMQQQHQQQQLFASMMAAAAAQQHSMMHALPSPTSPAEMIGTPENMMLPPPPVVAAPFIFGNHDQSAANSEGGGKRTQIDQPRPPIPPSHSRNGSNSPSDNKKLHPMSNAASQQQHISWLRQLNERARTGQVQNIDTTTGLTNRQTTVSTSSIHPSEVPPLGGPPVTFTPPPGLPHHHFGLPFSPFPHITFYGPAAVAAAAVMQQDQNPPEESEEKRNLRLARNRESARKSRRRKKERLVALEAQVDDMHNKIANERYRLIDKLVPGLRKCRKKQMEAFLDASMETEDGRLKANLSAIMTCVRETGPLSPIFQAVLEFQGKTLQAALLPRYQKFWLWLGRNDEAFFSAGKEEFAERDADGIIVRTSAGKISSKQVGDELANGVPTTRNSKRQSAQPNQQSDTSVDRTSRSDDASRMWPLMCYEHQFSVDQEDKILALHKKLRNKLDIEESWQKSQDATTAASSLCRAIQSVCQVASQREERTLVGILTVQQIMKYRQWIVINHERCNRSMHNNHTPGQLMLSQEDDGVSSVPLTCPPSQTAKESLQEICQRLQRVLRISNKKTGN